MSPIIPEEEAVDADRAASKLAHPHAPSPSALPAASVARTYRDIGAALLAGGVAGGLSRTAVAPLERLKILLQVQATQVGSAPKYTGVWQGLTYMMRTEGLRGMFKGNGANCLRIVPNSAVKFLTYEHVSRLILEQRRATTADAELTPLLRLGAGAVAGIIAMSATYPLDMVRGRLTVQADGTASAYTGLAHAVRTIAAKEGAGAFYKGWLPSVIGVVPYVGLNFAVYETLKAQAIVAAGVRDERDLAVATKLAAGAVAGSVGQTVAYPLDVVRRRLQVTGWSASGGSVAAAPAYTGMTDCFVQTVRHEGFGALFKGLWPNYLKVVPSIAIAFVSYEQLKELLGVSFRISD